MSMLTTHFSNLCMTPAVVKKLLGFKAQPFDPQLTTDVNHNKMCEKAIRALVKKLKKSPGALEELERAITTRDQSTKCIIIPTKASPQQDRAQISRKTLPHVVYCRIWRWPDLHGCNELKSVSHCQQGYHTNSSSNKKESEPMVCINPYHYIRCEPSLQHNESSATLTAQPTLTVFVPKLPLASLPPPPAPPSSGFTLIESASSSTSSIAVSVGADVAPQQQLSLTGELVQSSNYMITASPSPIGSVLSPQSMGIVNQFSPFISEDDSSEINDISPSPLGPFDFMPVTMIEQPYWCSLSYYEMKQRVGEMFHVASDVHSVTIDGYTDPSSAQRFCLGVLSNVNRTNEIEMTRHYIGRGLALSYENGQVFAECLSENPVFVQSPNCNQRYNWHLATVVKIPPGCNLKIFDEADFIKLANETVYQGYEAVYALTRICTIRISFVKGWGAEYRRQTILNTPCWIEVHLNNPLKFVDNLLTKMGSPRTKCTSVS